MIKMDRKITVRSLCNLEEPRIEVASSLKTFKVLKSWLPNLGKKDKILDAGCGGGIFGRLLKKELGAYVFGVDITKEALEFAKKRGLRVKKGNLEEKIPFTDEFFDLIVCRQVIEHLFDPDKALDEFHRVLKKKGFLFMTTPNLAAWFNRILLLLGIQPFFLETSTVDKTVGLGLTRGLTSHRQPLGHLRVYTLGALRDLLHLHGFRLEKFTSLAVPYFPWYISFVDRIFSLFPALGSDLLVLAQRE